MNMPAALVELRSLWQAAIRGEIAVGEALKQAARKDIVASLDDDVAIGASKAALKVISQDYDDWKPAVLLHALLYAAWDARKGRAPGLADGQLTSNWLDIVSLALWHVPDPSLFKDAVTRGERAATWLEQQGNSRAQATILNGLGTIHLDPYAARRDPRSLANELHDWRRRAFTGETWDGARYGDLEKEGYPAPLAALETAAAYYKRAAALRQGRQRARSLKALAQTLGAVALFGAEVDRTRVAEVAREAISLLDPAVDGPLVVELGQYLEQAGDKAAAPVPAEWLARSLDASVAAYGLDSTRLTVQMVLSTLLDQDPQRALRLAADAQPLFGVDARQRDYTKFHFQALQAFAVAYGFRASDYLADKSRAPREIVEQLKETAGREQWDPARLAAGLAAVAEYTTAVDEELFGLELLKTMQTMAPLATAPLSASWVAVRTQFLLNEGVNAVKREDWDRAIQFYAVALAEASSEGSAPVMTELLWRLADVARRGGVRGAEALAQVLRDRTDAIELAGGEAARDTLQTIYRVAIEAILANQGDAGALWTLVQLARGRQFAAMIAAGSALRAGATELDQAALERIASVRAELSAASHEGPSELIQDGALLSPYRRGSLQLSGAGPGERLLNLEHAFDVARYNAMVGLSAGTSGLLAGEEAVRAALGEDTVLLQYYFPAPMDADPRLVVSVTTRQETRWASAQVNGVSRPYQMVLDGIEVYGSWVNGAVQTLRERVDTDPGAEPVGAEGRETLAEMTRLLVKPVAEILDKCRAGGATHLCIAPFGPLTYAPLHLLGPYPKTLSGEWTVTYLPSLQLLASNQGVATLLRQRQRAVAAFGLSFAGSPNPIPEAVGEAEAVARAFGLKAMVEQQATRAAVLEAMQTARFVHIASHGAHEPLAPMFQSMRLAPSPDDDGTLHAHQLLGLDLRGLELVTLSACETALGRFDAGDNPHGLSAMLLLAGAQTIIGTLWEVETTCSERFFTALYERLAEGESKLQAFRGAIMHTRKQHPQFRDWGAFYLTGSWR